MEGRPAQSGAIAQLQAGNLTREMPGAAAQLLTLGELEAHLWESANILRGPIDQADFKSYSTPISAVVRSWRRDAAPRRCWRASSRDLVARSMSADRAARKAFICGVSFGVLALGVDMINTNPWSDSTLLAEQTVEDIVELLAQSLMALVLIPFILSTSTRSGGESCVAGPRTRANSEIEL